ncbi:MAG TPA: ribosome maturation factor RimM [Anaeromyxobacter sp.]
MALVRIGKVVRAVGLKGFVGIAGSSGALGEVAAIVLRRAGADETRRIEEARPQGRVWAVKLEGVSDRTAAEGLVGAEVLAPRDELEEAGEGQYLWTDLEGLEVVTVAGELVGQVTELYETGGVDVLVVTGGARGEKLIPLAPYVEVDRAARRIVVDPPDGLLD